MSGLDVGGFLVEKGLLRPEDRAGITVRERSRRNENYLVTNPAGRSFFLKRSGSNGREALCREAGAYEFLSADVSISRLLAPYLGHDPGAGVLTLELLPGAEDLQRYHDSLSRFPAGIAAMAGEALAAVHEACSEGSLPPAPLPAVLSLHHVRPDDLRHLSGGHLALLRKLQQDIELCEYLDAARSNWSADAFIHGDLRWSNLLLSNDSSRILLVDWELSGAGAAAWDIAGYFANYLRAWVLSMQPVPGGTPERLAESARLPLATMHVSIGSFWNTYVAGRTRAGSALLLSSIRLLPARLLQIVYERLRAVSVLTFESEVLLGLAGTIRVRPEEAATQLLGLSDSSGAGA